MADEDYIAQQVSRNMQRASRRSSGQEYSLHQSTKIGQLDFPTAPQFNFRPNNTRSVVADYGQQRPDLMRLNIPKGIGTAIGAGIDYMYGRADKDKDKDGEDKPDAPTPDAPKPNAPPTAGGGGFPQLNTGAPPRIGLPSGQGPRPGLPSGGRPPLGLPPAEILKGEIITPIDKEKAPQLPRPSRIIDVEGREVFPELPVAPGSVRQIGTSQAPGLPAASTTTSRSPSAGREIRALGSGQRPALGSGQPPAISAPIAIGPGPTPTPQPLSNVGSHITVAHGRTWSVDESNDWTPLGDDTSPEDFFKRPGPMGANSPRNVAARQARAAARRRSTQ